MGQFWKGAQNGIFFLFGAWFFGERFPDGFGQFDWPIEWVNDGFFLGCAFLRQQLFDGRRRFLVFVFFFEQFQRK